MYATVLQQLKTYEPLNSWKLAKIKYLWIIVTLQYFGSLGSDHHGNYHDVNNMGKCQI